MKMLHPFALVAASVVGLSATVMAQTAPNPPASQSQAARTIGKPQSPRIVPSMIVLNAKAARIEGKKLVLDGISPNAIVFADRPVRSAGHALTAHLIEEWGDSAPDSFAKTPPNATVSAFSKAKAGVVDAVVVLKSPRLEGDRLTFDIDLLEGSIAGADGAASLFMDIINLPIARRTSVRGAWYHAGSQ